MIRLTTTTPDFELVTIELPISKSIANRELILAFLSGTEQSVWNERTPDDVRILSEALYSGESTWDLGHAGTAMRFATALVSIGNQSRVLSGSERMHQRPIRILVDALRDLGADIQYLEQEGYPPIEIKPAHSMGGTTSIDGSVSSQYISALLLVAPCMQGGLDLELLPPVTSRPYVDLTLDVMRKKGIHFTSAGNNLRIPYQPIAPCTLSDNRDWSAAAFFYGLVAQGHPEAIYFPDLDLDSAQGDRELISLFEPLGVSTEAYTDGVRIFRVECSNEDFKANLSDQPDLAQAIAFTCAALGRSCHLTGLHTLRIKETDRIAAILECLEAIGCIVESGADWIQVSGKPQPDVPPIFESYNDHRMAMAVSILTPVVGSLYIENEEVVSKSFPEFWEVIARSGSVQIIRT